MKTLDPLLFLIGHKGAIQRIASSPWALLVGVILVYTAGIARHYDFHQLHIETKWMWAPFLVVLVSSFLIYMFLHISFYNNDGTKEMKPFMSQYLSFLGLFMMTAPIAWLYAIPIEHLWPKQPLACAKFNIALLAIVSLWRVVLMILVVRFVTGVDWPYAVSCIFGPASVEAFFGSISKSLDPVAMMGGIELSPTEEFLQQAYYNISTISLIIAIPSFFIFIAACLAKTELKIFQFKSTSFPKGAIGLAVILLFVWIGIALPFQINSGLRQPRLELEKMAEKPLAPAAKL